MSDVAVRFDDVPVDPDPEPLASGDARSLALSAGFGEVRAIDGPPRREGNFTGEVVLMRRADGLGDVDTLLSCEMGGRERGCGLARGSSTTN